MQYVRNLSDSVSTAWNSINPATLSGAIDVIVIELEDGSLQCSPFHVRFGKFSLLRPSDKKVEFRVNGVRQDFSMKLGEGGEAFFVFETSDSIPLSMQTSPLISPITSPPLKSVPVVSALQEPDPLDLNDQRGLTPEPSEIATYSASVPLHGGGGLPSEWPGDTVRQHSDLVHGHGQGDRTSNMSAVIGSKDAIERAMTLSRELLAANIPSQVSLNGDLMLDMTGFKSSEEDAARADGLARKILAEELDANNDLDSLLDIDGQGNIWIYSSLEAKAAASKPMIEQSLQTSSLDIAVDAASDPGYQSDGSDIISRIPLTLHRRTESDLGPIERALSAASVNRSPLTARDSNSNYAKTLRLTSDQLRALNLNQGENVMSFTVNRATCHANMYLWAVSTPVVISDIDGTITKSDALGHVLNMIGRDWTHSGVAKLYSDIAANGYNIMYLTSRSVGQADTTRAYLHGVVQEGCRLPRGPTILSPDRTMAALRREIYLRKPHIFKMATLRDIRGLYGPDRSPFYAGFGNRLTDQLSYRTVDVPRTRIFTINSNAEVSLDLLSLNKLKMSYVNINEVVDHYFPSVSMLVTGGGEEYTDFTYWRDLPLDIGEFSASGGEDGFSDGDDDETHEGDDDEGEGEEVDDDDDQDEDEDPEDDDGVHDRLADSFVSRESADEYADQGDSGLTGSADLASSTLSNDDDSDRASGSPTESPASDPTESDQGLLVDTIISSLKAVETVGLAGLKSLAINSTPD